MQEMSILVRRGNDVLKFRNIIFSWECIHNRKFSVCFWLRKVSMTNVFKFNKLWWWRNSFSWTKFQWQIMSFNEIVFSGECLKAKKFSYTLLTSPHIIFAMISNRFRILTVYRANFRQSRFCDHDLFPQYNFFPNEKHCIFKLLILNLNRSFFTRDCFYVHSNYYIYILYILYILIIDT